MPGTVVVAFVIIVEQDTAKMAVELCTFTTLTARCMAASQRISVTKMQELMDCFDEFSESKGEMYRPTSSAEHAIRGKYTTAVHQYK